MTDDLSRIRDPEEESVILTQEVMEIVNSLHNSEFEMLCIHDLEPFLNAVAAGDFRNAWYHKYMAGPYMNDERFEILALFFGVKKDLEANNYIFVNGNNLETSLEKVEALKRYSKSETGERDRSRWDDANYIPPGERDGSAEMDDSSETEPVVVIDVTPQTEADCSYDENRAEIDRLFELLGKL